MIVDNSVLVEMLPGVLRAASKENPQMAPDVDQFILTENAAASVSRHGNFTVAVIDYLGESFIGVAKRNPSDAPHPKRGDRLALSRALKALVLNNVQ